MWLPFTSSDLVVLACAGGLLEAAGFVLRRLTRRTVAPTAEVGSRTAAPQARAEATRERLAA